MTNKCPECGSTLGAKEASCPNCGLLSVERAVEPGLSLEQEAKISEAVSRTLLGNKRFLWSISWRTFLWIMTVVGLVAGWGIISIVQNVKQAARTRLDTLDRNMSNLVAEAYIRVSSNITEEFRDPRIHKTVEDVAGKEAKAILESEVQPTVGRFRNDAEFLRLATRARAYDFKAYLRLLDLQKGTNDLAHYAEEVVLETDRSLEKDRSQFMPHKVYAIYSGTNLYGGPFTSDELVLRFPITAQDKTAYNREGFVNTVGDLREPLFLGSLVSLLANEADLGVADRLTIAISTLTKQDFHPRDFDAIQTWWQSHGTEYTNWPISEFNQGFASFLASSYSAAAVSFQKVLKVDPFADMSRAFAIGSLLEIGETNQALELSKGFKLATGRWAQWSAAKAELETGSVSNATVQFATLAAKNPTMMILPVEGSAVFRKLDWGLFHQVASKP
jgi:hypothetical protein